MEISLEGKVAVVTGAGPNIGSGIATALAAYGAKVACVDLQASAAEATAARITAHGGTAMAISGDVTDEAQVQAYIDRILAEWGQIDILVNNAARMGGWAGVLDETADNFMAAVGVAGLGCLLNTKYAARSMAERGIRGSIVCISSSSGWLGNAGFIAYSFQKGGVNNFVRGAAMELAPYGIRVNGFTPTAPTPDNPELDAKQPGPRGSGLPDTGAEPWRRPLRWGGEAPPLAPMGSTGTPTDIGHTVAWMCSDYARFITGCDFTVDGGLRAKNPQHIAVAPEDMVEPIPVVPLFN
ncbi:MULTISPECIES: SDR family oxidoreductase [unclassified Microbacterium]|uniref:SDR family NAD(P)-dependent oxidoreductase n=1 Tax=unclassified Microbacterium TaxID=2609290 RepID=UPI00214ABFCE|nr:MULTISPECIES: SDR family oxidoreductase [unclassified Microbacterium]MCR2808403.1 SDR family oxidoreductase [Microbacterium sp. zg.B185]WIM19151.1 SDR family oxidoreductase [Microbacterium sp. zg-B185]